DRFGSLRERRTERGHHDDLHAPIGRVGLSLDKALALECVDDQCRVRRIDPERGGELAHCHRCPSDPPQGSDPTEVETEGLACLTSSYIAQPLFTPPRPTSSPEPAFCLPPLPPHQRALSRNSGFSPCPARSALGRPKPVVTTRPRTSTAAPHPERTIQAA